MERVASACARANKRKAWAQQQPAAKVAETRLLQCICIPHHDRKSLLWTKPIKIWAWIKISQPCQLPSPHPWALPAADPSTDNGWRLLNIDLSPAQGCGGGGAWKGHCGLDTGSKWNLSKLPNFQICPKVPSFQLWSAITVPTMLTQQMSLSQITPFLPGCKISHAPWRI